MFTNFYFYLILLYIFFSDSHYFWKLEFQNLKEGSPNPPTLERLSKANFICKRGFSKLVMPVQMVKS